MRHVRLAFLLAGVLAVLLAGVRPSAQAPGVTAQLDRYLQGHHDAVVDELRALKNFDEVLEVLRRDGQAWVEAGPDEARARRRLAAATFALEAARAAEQADWKLVKRLEAWVDDITKVAKPEGADRVYWQAPSLLIEWGCALLRQQREAPPIERVWHLAAIAVAHRIGDHEFLIGSPWSPRMNAGDELEHLEHTRGRVQKDPRFALASAIAVERTSWPSVRGVPWMQQQTAAVTGFKRLLDDEAVGAEASVRLGALYTRLRRLDDALSAFAKAETMTRDRYLIYLARYFKGQALDRVGRVPEAEEAYQAALATIPQAQSATMALAGLLAKQDRRAEAASLVEANLSTTPQPLDPWRAYGAADDRFWPELIGRLRAEIQR